MTKSKPTKQVTLEHLAAMVQRGFEGMDRRFEETAQKSDIVRLEQRLDRFERIVIADHERRLKRLEADIDYLKNALAIK